jgi:hypothetical protein
MILSVRVFANASGRTRRATHLSTLQLAIGRYGGLTVGLNLGKTREPGANAFGQSRRADRLGSRHSPRSLLGSIKTYSAMHRLTG